jgi:hypothetical protein
MTPHDQDNLERLVTQAVRQLPPRPAPSTLEARVMAEIARRAALPWWRKSFVHWPVAARSTLIATCAAAVVAMIKGTMFASAGFGAAQLKAAFAPEMESLDAALRVVAAARDVTGSLVGSIPPLWLYGGAAVIVALYVALFGLGAAAYRTLYASS